MAVITPDNSGAMSAPRTARSVPTAWNSPCHSVNCALAVETVWAGAPCAEMLFFITPPRKALKPNSPPNNTPTATNMMIMRLVMNATPYDFSFSVCGFRGKSLPLALHTSAAQRLGERRGVRVAHRLRLDETDPCLFVLARRPEEREIARRAELGPRATDAE